MKHLCFIISWALWSLAGFAQRPIRDKHITYQQERMVFKQWDRKKFTPTKGFLGLNPEYWITWGLHPDYPKKDQRPLSGAGPQTQRLALVLSMRNTENAYKLESDTLETTAISESVNYLPLISDVDPLWVLYYRHELDPLTNPPGEDPVSDLPEREHGYMNRTGLTHWYLQEFQILSERLSSARTTVLDRGSRMLTYHRILSEYRRFIATWEAKKQFVTRLLDLMETAGNVRKKEMPIVSGLPSRTDKQIADAIISSIKF